MLLIWIHMSVFSVNFLIIWIDMSTLCLEITFALRKSLRRVIWKHASVLAINLNTYVYSFIQLSSTLNRYVYSFFRDYVCSAQVSAQSNVNTHVCYFSRNNVSSEWVAVQSNLNAYVYFSLNFLVIWIHMSMMMIAVITFNCSLVPLIEGLCSSTPWYFEFSGFRRNRTDDLGINSPSLWPAEPRLHVRSITSLETTMCLRESLCRVIWIHMSNISSNLNKRVYSFSRAPSFHISVRTFVSAFSGWKLCRGHIHTYTHTHIHTYTHTHIHTYTLTHLHTYTHIQTHTCTHVHTYT